MAGYQNFRTPLALYNALEERFGPFGLDPWASDEWHLCLKYFTEQTDGFKSVWPIENVFGNPPFARSGEAVKCGYDHARRTDRTVCLLLQAGISTAWFHKYALKGTVLIPDCRINYWLPEEEKARLVAEAIAAGKKPPTFAGFNRDSIIVLFGDGYWDGGIRDFKIRGELKGTKVAA